MEKKQKAHAQNQKAHTNAISFEKIIADIHMTLQIWYNQTMMVLNQVEDQLVEAIASNALCQTK